VLEDADLDAAVKGALWGPLPQPPESCVASKRLIVLEPLATGCLGKLKPAMDRLRMGNPHDEATTLAPLSSPRKHWTG